MGRRKHRQKKRGAERRVFPAARTARLSFERDLRHYGFEAAEIEAAWSRSDEVERVAIELMALAAGLASIEDLASDVVHRARNTFGSTGLTQMPFEKIEPIARRAWEEWETSTGRPLEERPSSVPAAGVVLLLEESEQKLGWTDYPAGNAGMAARIIVRMELFSVIGRGYPALKDECRRQFRDEWERWRLRGSGAALSTPPVGVGLGSHMETAIDKRNAPSQQQSSLSARRFYAEK
ncbi:MAG TPA: hypothetical protein VNJ12_02165 [Candidatus Dormibacteraeota bacterium]|nr:hypothetical protein [Candidatus Dormibacteraeota bacterium]